MAREDNIGARIRLRDEASSAFVNVAKSTGLVVGAFGALAAILGTRALVTGFLDSAKAAAEFDTEMSKVAGVTRATAEEMEGLESAAKELGRTTVFTAREAAAAQTEFARAGFEVNEILAAVGPALNLAAVGNLDLAESAGIAANILRSMSLEVEELTRVTDVLAKTASISNQQVSDIGQAFVFVGSAANIIGAELEEVNAALALLADRGIKGSIAGTALRTTFATFVGDLEDGQKGLEDVGAKLFDTEGRFLGLANAIEVMLEEGIDASQAFEIFGQRAGSAMATLLTLGPDALRQTTEELQNAAGFAQETADIFLDNLGGAVKELKSAWEGFRIEVGQTITQSPIVNEAIAVLTDGLNWLTDSITANREVIDDLVRRGLVGMVRGLKLLGETAVELYRIFETARIGFNVWASEQISTLAAVLGAWSEVFNRMAEFPSSFALFLGGIENVESLRDALGSAGLELAKVALGFQAAARSGVENMSDVEERVKALNALLDETANRLTSATEPREAMTFTASLELESPISEIEDLLPPESLQLPVDFSLPDEDEIEESLSRFEPFGDVFDAAIESWREFKPTFENAMQSFIGQFGALGDLALSTTAQLGDALGAAAVGADVAWSQMWDNFLRSIVSAIAQAAILAAILSAAGKGSFGTLFLEGLGFQHGGIVPDRPTPPVTMPQPMYGRDSIPAIVSPGEAILPEELTDFLLEAASRGTGHGDVIRIQTDVPSFVARVNQGVRDGTVRMVASAVGTPRSRR